MNNYRVIMLSVLFFSFVLFSSRPSSFSSFVRKVRKRCSQSRFSSEAIILRVRVFSVAVDDGGYFVESSNDGR